MSLMFHDLLSLFRDLEKAFPSPVGCHHSLTLHDKSERDELLVLQLFLPSTSRVFLLDYSDFDRPAEDLVAEIVRLLAQEPQKT